MREGLSTCSPANSTITRLSLHTFSTMEASCLLSACCSDSVCAQVACNSAWHSVRLRSRSWHRCACLDMCVWGEKGSLVHWFSDKLIPLCPDTAVVQ